MLQVDRAIVESLNRIAQHEPLRLAALLAADYLIVVPIAILAGLVVAALRRRDTHALALAALGAAGAAGALGLDQLAGHLYFRLRPYWALPTVHPIGPRAGSSSFFSPHATLAAALLGLLVAVGQVMIGAHYPADVLTGLLVGGLAVAALLPLRRWLQRLLDRLLHTGRAPAASRPQELRLGVVGLVLLVGLGGWLVARVQDHGLRVALNRADARLAHHLPTDARLYRPASIDRIATGRWRPTRARVYGQVTFVNRELDGDVHVQLKAPDGSFVVLEIIPELPMAAPHDDRITAWGIVRHDGLHNWWELHPLIGWAHGHVNAPSTGGLDD